jgi:NifU-like protein involved in Fe-S cluster formation
MTKRIRFDHKRVGDPYVITSPDIISFHVTGKTADEAERAAIAMLDFPRRADTSHELVRLKAINLEYEPAAA